MKVYLSSTFRDLEQYRAAVFAGLEKAGLDVARMEAYTAADQRPLDLCLADVASSDIYIGILAWRYGYVPPAAHGNPESKSITELEYRQASASRLRKLIFLADPATRERWPQASRDDLTGEGDGGEKLRRLRDELSTDRTVAFFRSPEELATLVLAAILRSGQSGRPFNVPPRRSGVVARPALTATLVGLLLEHKAPGGAPILVKGPGGAGKSTLALDACYVTEVVGEFPGGVLWATLGEQPNLATVLAGLYKLLTGRPAGEIGAEALGQSLASELAGRKCLIVVDDVWRPDTLQPFLALDGPRLIVTTRIQNLAEECGHPDWPELVVDEMDPEEAFELLGRTLPLDTPGASAVRRLAGDLGQWPLLLELANARLIEEYKRRGLAEAIAQVRQIFEHYGVLGFDRRNSLARTEALKRSLAASLEFAEQAFPGITRRAADLSIFPEDVAVPAAVLAELWHTGEFEIEEEILRPLDNVAVVRWDRRANQVSLHDVIRRALAAQLDYPADVHRTLVDAWNDPRHLPHAYAWRWYVWHCVRAGELTRITDRLSDYEWLRGKLRETEINALLTDFDSITGSENPGIPEETRAAYKEIQSVLQLSAHVLARDPSQLAGQLAGRLCPDSSPAARALATALQRLDEPALLVPLAASLRHAGGALERSLDDDRGVMSLAFVDNRTLLAGGYDRFIRVWNLADGSAKAVLPAFSPDPSGWDSGRVAAITLTNDGARVAAISEGGTIKLWEWAGWREILVMRGSVLRYGRAILALSPDGTRAVSGPSHEFRDQPLYRLTVWNIQTGRAERFLSAPKGVYDADYGAVAISPDGLQVAAGDEHGTVAVWELQSGEQRQRWSVGRDKVQALAYTAKGHLLICAGGRGEVWNPGEQKRDLLLDGTTGDVQSMAVFARTSKMLTASADGRLRVWDLETGRQLGALVEDDGAIQSAAVSPDGSRAVSTTGRTIKVWSLGDMGAPDASPELPAVLNISTQTGSRQAFVTTASGLSVWDVDDLRARRSFAKLAGNIVATDGRRAVYSSGWSLHRLDLSTGEESSMNREERVLNPACTAVALVPNSEMALFVFADHTPRELEELGASFDDTVLQLWDFASRKRVAAVSLRHIEDVDAIAVLPDGSAAVVTTPNYRMELRELPSLKVLDTLPTGNGYVGSIAVPAAGRQFVTGGSQAAVWDLAARQQVHVLDGHTSSVNAVAVSPDCRFAVTATEGFTVRVWDVEEARVLAQFTGDSAMLACAIVPEAEPGRVTIVAGERSGRLHFLRMRI